MRSGQVTIAEQLGKRRVRQLVRRYLAGESPNRLGRDFRVSGDSILRMLRKLGVPIRSKKQAAQAWVIKDGLSKGMRMYKRRVAAGLCVECGGAREPDRVLCGECRENARAYRAEKRSKGLCARCFKPADAGCLCSTCKSAHDCERAQLKDAAYAAYRGYRCACCGITEPVFLCLDHVNNDGAEHRRKGNYCGLNLYRWLRKHGYPPGFQVLCHNCNFAKQFGPCPHQKAQVLTRVAK